MLQLGVLIEAVFNDMLALLALLVLAPHVARVRERAYGVLWL
jgi:DNA-binding SARP family transcriptional activator